MSKSFTSVEDINRLLPQTQCGECRYNGCKPYARAMHTGKDSIHHCHPGGVPTLLALAAQLKVDPKPYIAEIAQRTSAPQIAVIIESDCIGCTKCIQACPVDAIIGAAKLMHTVINQECTGCELCVSPCPVDCIELKPIEKPIYDRQKAKKRYEAQQIRLKQQRQQKQSLNAHYLAKGTASKNEYTDKQAYIQAAIARVRIKKARLKQN